MSAPPVSTQGATESDAAALAVDPSTPSRTMWCFTSTATYADRPSRLGPSPTRTRRSGSPTRSEAVSTGNRPPITSGAPSAMARAVCAFVAVALEGAVDVDGIHHRRPQGVEHLGLEGDPGPRQPGHELGAGQRLDRTQDLELHRLGALLGQVATLGAILNPSSGSGPTTVHATSRPPGDRDGGRARRGRRPRGAHTMRPVDEAHQDVAARVALRLLVDTYAHHVDRRRHRAPWPSSSATTARLVAHFHTGARRARPRCARAAPRSRAALVAGLDRYRATTHVVGGQVVEIDGDRAARRDGVSGPPRLRARRRPPAARDGGALRGRLRVPVRHLALRRAPAAAGLARRPPLDER